MPRDGGGRVQAIKFPKCLTASHPITHLITVFEIILKAAGSFPPIFPNPIAYSLTCVYFQPEKAPTLD